MHQAHREFAEYAVRCEAKFLEIQGEELDALEAGIVRRFVRPDTRRGIWESLAYPFCYYRSDEHREVVSALRLLVPERAHGRTVVWPDYPDAAAYCFSDINQVGVVLSKLLWSEFLLTDAELSFLLIYSDHGILYGLGDALPLVDSVFGVEHVALVTGGEP